MKVQRFQSHEAAAQADRAYYRSLKPEQRLDVLLELVRAHLEGIDETQQGLARVYRIVELGGD